MATERADTSHHSGWKQVEGRFFRGPAGFDTVTADFAIFAERSRARWDLAEYLKTLISQYRERENSKHGKHSK
jgi:hypothetical protein